MRGATICVAIVLAAGSAQAADRTKAQAHARKANSLAAGGKCKQAIPEYNAAYRLLKDPALLFNRAECLRKVGKGAQALYDYRQFLQQLPSAPNRAVVESRIAALDPSSAPVQVRTILQAPPVQVRTIVEAPPVEAPAAPAPSLHAAALRMPVPVEAPPPPLPAPRSVEDRSTLLVARRPPPEAPAPASDSRAWIWLSVAAAVVAGSAAGALYIAGRPRTP
jgi:tetratricopeptide (TPR) repeat protein